MADSEVLKKSVIKYGPCGPATFLEDKVSVKNAKGEDIELPVMTIKPLKPLGRRIMIIYGGSRDKDFRMTIRPLMGCTLASWGYTVHCFDFRSNLSEENFYDYGLYDRLTDSGAVLKWLLEKSPLRDQPLSLMGVSMGGPIAIRLVQLNEPQLESLSLIAPAAYDWLADRYWVKFGDQFKEIISVRESWRQSESFLLLKTTKLPVQLTGFRDDEVVSYEIFSAYVSALCSRRQSKLLVLHLMQGFGHEGNFTDPEKVNKVVSSTADFLDAVHNRLA